jgi:hypothetical protein
MTRRRSRQRRANLLGLALTVLVLALLWWATTPVPVPDVVWAP